MQIHAKAQHFMRLPEVLNLVGVTRSTLYRWMDAGTFPRQISVGGNTVVWVESAVTSWMEEQMASRWPRQMGGPKYQQNSPKAGRS